MYEIQTITLPLTHGGVSHLRIYGNGYIMDAIGFTAGYSMPHCEIHFLSREEDTDSYKEVRLTVLQKGRRIAPGDVHPTVPIKTIHIANHTFLITAQYL